MKLVKTDFGNELKKLINFLITFTSSKSLLIALSRELVYFDAANKFNRSSNNLICPSTILLRAFYFIILLSFVS